MIDWSVVCPACGGPGRIVRDVFGDASIVCDAYGECAPDLDAEIAEAEHRAVALSARALSHELACAEDADARAMARLEAAEARCHAGALRSLRETRLAETHERLGAWRAAVASW